MIRIFFALLFLFLGTFSVWAQDLRVLTSFPPAVSSTYVERFKTLHKEGEIQVLNKNTVAGIDEILRGNQRQFDIFWSSSPEAFDLLRKNNAFAEDTVCDAHGVRSVEPFALSSTGWARRRDSTLFMPGEWNDLLKPIYRNQIAMARPARSGTAHLLVEQLLLVRGWDAGWAYFLELSGNLSTLTARSFGVPNGVINKRYEIGLTIDFLAQSKSELLQFRYGRPIVLVPAHIGILKNGLAKQKACEFVAFVLSEAGQKLLLKPEISRIPYSESVRTKAVGQIPKDIIDALKLSWLDYDAQTSARRYWAVNTLFDLMISETLDKRRQLWRRYRSLKKQHSDNALAMIRQALTRVVVSEDEAAGTSDITQKGLRRTSLSSLGSEERKLVRQWRKRVATQLEAAEALLLDIEQGRGQ